MTAAADAFAEFLAERVATLVAERIAATARHPVYATAKQNPLGSARRFRDAARTRKFPAHQMGREIWARWEDVEKYMEPTPVPKSRSSTEKELKAELDAALERPGRRSPDGFVYFLRADGTGLIKIGVTCDVKARVATIAGSCGDGITLLHAMAGTRVDERGLHQRFTMARRNGEWFEPVPELLAYIEELKAGV